MKHSCFSLTMLFACSVILFCSVCSVFSQSGPIGRAVRATQVTVDTTMFVTVNTTNTILQAALLDMDRSVSTHTAALYSLSTNVNTLDSSRTIILKGATTLPGGAVIENPANTYTIYFNTSSGGSTTNGTISGYGSTVMPPGSVISWPMDVPPDGWVLCDGAAFSTTTYADLFSKIGWRYSSATGTTFKVPDYRGVVLRGVDALATYDKGVSNRVASGLGGTALTAGSFQASTYCTTNSTVEARLPNKYVNWIIKYRDDTKFFASSATIAQSTNFTATVSNGVLSITYPPQATNVVAYSQGSTSWLLTPVAHTLGAFEETVTSTTNRTIIAVASLDSTAFSENAGSWSASLRDPSNVINAGAWFEVMFQQTPTQGAGIYGARLAVSFDVPAGFLYKLVHAKILDAGGTQTYSVNTIWKP